MFVEGIEQAVTETPTIVILLSSSYLTSDTFYITNLQEEEDSYEAEGEN